MSNAIQKYGEGKLTPWQEEDFREAGIKLSRHIKWDDFLRCSFGIKSSCTISNIQGEQRKEKNLQVHSKLNIDSFHFSWGSAATSDKADKMEVHFINVGQGDFTLIICGSHSMLIDTGDDSKGTLIQNYLKKQKFEKLDYLILIPSDANKDAD